MIRTSFVTDDDHKKPDYSLADELYRQLGMPLNKFVKLTVAKTRKAINNKEGLYDLNVRCYRTEKKPSPAFCFKEGRHGDKSGMPDIILGFNGDIDDFEIALIHELLHLFRWDEKIIEAEALEIKRVYE